MAQISASRCGPSPDRSRRVAWHSLLSFISQVENGFCRVPTNIMEEWARTLNISRTKFKKTLLSYYDPQLYLLLFKVRRP